MKIRPRRLSVWRYPTSRIYYRNSTHQTEELVRSVRRKVYDVVVLRVAPDLADESLRSSFSFLILIQEHLLVFDKVCQFDEI